MLEFCAHRNQNRDCEKHLKSNNRQIAILSFVGDGLELVRGRIYYNILLSLRRPMI